VRRTCTAMLAILLLSAGCASSATADGEVAAVEACDEYATFVRANLAKESDTSVILDRAIARATAAAAADQAYAELASDMTSRRQVAEDLTAALAGDAAQPEAIGAVIDLMSDTNVAVSVACADLGITVDVIG
jgi:hypothetical protein